MIEYRQNRLTAKELYDYLNENDKIFKPPLSARLNIEEYSNKLYKYATHFCAYEDKRLIALIACYLNDRISKIAFVSSVSVLKNYQNKGISRRLLEIVIDNCRKNLFNTIKLELRRENIDVLHLYEKAGFQISSEENGILSLELKF